RCWHPREAFVARDTPTITTVRTTAPVTDHLSAMSKPMKESSSTGEITDHSQHGRIDDNSASILAFPTEILVMIIKFAALDPKENLIGDPFANPYSYEAGKTIALTCSLFNHLVLPFIYYSFLLDYSGGMVPKWKAPNLYRAMANNPWRGQCCRNLTIRIANTEPRLDEAGYGEAERLSRWFSSVRHLKVRGTSGSIPKPQTWSFIRHCSTHMRGIDILSLGGWKDGFYQRRLFEIIDMPSLRSLHLKAVRADPDESTSLHPDRYGSAQFTNLVLLAYGESASSLKELLKWPRKLELFYLSYCFHKESALALSMMDTLLRDHKDTLRAISLSYLNLGGRVPDLSGFPALESLSICRSDMTVRLTQPDDDAHRLLAPKLRVFQWNFELPRPSWTSFEDEEERWLRAFSEVAITRRAALETIKVIFNSPEPKYADGDESPWSRMNKIRNDVAKHGLRIKYGD
ncbi:Uncharacterized protein TCAP_05206, partial [Tolypocladium capitatum]